MRTNLHSMVIGNFLILILGRKPSVCLDNHCFIGSHPNSKNKSDFGMFILVFRINLATYIATILKMLYLHWKMVSKLHSHEELMDE